MSSKAKKSAAKVVVSKPAKAKLPAVIAKAKTAAPAAKAAPKSAKGASKSAPAAAPTLQAAAEGVDPDELEEAADAAAAGGSGGGGAAAAAAAAAGGSTEMSASFKNFRHHPDMENFYRFIYENDLRHEALAIIGDILIEKQKMKALKAAKAQAH